MTCNPMNFVNNLYYMGVGMLSIFTESQKSEYRKERILYYKLI